jgi:hypothetical protein
MQQFALQVRLFKYLIYPESYFFHASLGWEPGGHRAFLMSSHVRACLTPVIKRLSKNWGSSGMGSRAFDFKKTLRADTLVLVKGVGLHYNGAALNKEAIGAWLSPARAHGSGP